MEKYDCLKLEPGHSFTQRMNYVAAKPVPKDKSKEYKPMSRPAKVYDCNLEEQLIPADTGIYTGTSGILLCGGYDDTKFDETIIDNKYVSLMRYAGIKEELYMELLNKIDNMDNNFGGFLESLKQI